MDALKALAQRRAVATSDDAVAAFIFNDILKLIARERGEAEAEAAKAAAGVPKRMVSLLKYPAVHFLSLVEQAAIRVQPPGGNVVETLQRIGASTIDGYLSSPMGAIVTSVNGGNAHRILQIAPTAFATTYTFGTMSYERTSDRSARVVCRRQLFGPGYLTGLLGVGLKQVCSADANVAVKDATEDGLDFTLHLDW